jgi:hypothetical protein
MSDYILLALFAVQIIALLFLVRVECTFHVRMKFLINKSLEDYDLLPNYTEMVSNPKYLFFWTFGQWESWAVRKQNGAYA